MAKRKKRELTDSDFVEVMTGTWGAGPSYSLGDVVSVAQLKKDGFNVERALEKGTVIFAEDPDEEDEDDEPTAATKEDSTPESDSDDDGDETETETKIVPADPRLTEGDGNPPPGTEGTHPVEGGAHVETDASPLPRPSFGGGFAARKKN